MLDPDKIENKQVEAVLFQQPKPIQKKLIALRQLIIEVAQQNKEIGSLEETLKWGEISYLAKKSSTIRISWTPSKPNQYGIYFNCKSKLVDTFKEVYRDTFNYESNRAILLDVNQEIPETALKHCILLALTYHNIKHLPLLGV